MTGALRPLLARRFGADEAARILQRWRQVFGLPNAAEAPAAVPERHQEYQDLLQLLLESAVDGGSGTAALARWIAYSCMGDNHLWEDLGLPDRPELTALMQEYFPRLRARNSGNMRWKKFLYKQLCERAEIFACRSPNCDTCSEYRLCFAPEARPAACVERVATL